MTLRTRTLTLIKEPYRDSNNLEQGYHREFVVRGTQATESQSNPWPHSKGSGADVGSAFSSTKQSISVDSPNRVDGSNPFNRYWGPIYSTSPAAALSDMDAKVSWSSNLTLNGLGATAISRVLPTNPATDAMVFAAELASDGIPKAIGQQLWASHKRPIKGLADENLNYQFGLAPTVNDTMSLVDTVSKSEKIMDQFVRDSGRNIRRQYRFPTIHEGTTTSTLLGVYPYAPVPLNYLTNRGNVTSITTFQRDVWFSGCFTYYLNLGTAQSDRLVYAAQQAKRLYGVRLTPDVLWNLAPWSWAADWVTNIGDVLHNLSAFSTDGLVMRYGYIMEHTTMIRSSCISGLRPATGVAMPSDRVSETYRYERKIRRRATPFGFGLDPGSFTTRQWSILASLGITRAMR